MRGIAKGCCRVVGGGRPRESAKFSPISAWACPGRQAATPSSRLACATHSFPSPPSPDHARWSSAGGGKASGRSSCRAAGRPKGWTRPRSRSSPDRPSVRSSTSAAVPFPSPRQEPAAARLPAGRRRTSRGLSPVLPACRVHPVQARRLLRVQVAPSCRRCRVRQPASPGSWARPSRVAPRSWRGAWPGPLHGFSPVLCRAMGTICILNGPDNHP